MRLTAARSSDVICDRLSSRDATALKIQRSPAEPRGPPVSAPDVHVFRCGAAAALTAALEELS